LSVTTAVTARIRRRVSVSMSSTSVLANTWSFPALTASSRMRVPICSESTTDTAGV
jgi:hypothetical protein